MPRGATIRIRLLVPALASVISAIVSSGCATNSSSSVVPPASAMISVCNRTESGCGSSASFSLASIRDLSVNVFWNHLAEGTHTQTVELVAPDGGSYQLQNNSFLIVNTGDGSAQTNAIFPIAGSWITVRGITGSWSLRVSLDGQNISTQSVEFQP